jgi:hypothetical protein
MPEPTPQSTPEETPQTTTKKTPTSTSVEIWQPTPTDP